MKIFTKILLLVFLAVFAFSCKSPREKFKERTIVFYIDAEEPDVPAKNKEIVNMAGQDKKGIAENASETFSVDVKRKFKKMFADIKDKMRTKGLLPGDLGKFTENYVFLKRAVQNDRFGGFAENHKILKNAINKIKINEVFIKEKYARIREAVKTIDPGEKALIEIENKIIKVEQLIEEQHFDYANSVLNEIFDKLEN